jgi:hypothetical protein
VTSTADEHFLRAQQNERFANQIDLNTSPVAVHWVVTILFYAALHYVQAYFAALGRKHGLHTTRASDIQRDNRIAVIYDDFRQLSDMSRDARYECSALQPGHIKFAQERLEQIKSDLKPFLPQKR